MFTWKPSCAQCFSGNCTMRHATSWDLIIHILHLTCRRKKLPEAVQGLRTMGARGWNITMPGKNIMCKLADKVSPASEISGACNTIVNDNGVLTAYTTDGVGFMRAVAENGVDIIGKKDDTSGSQAVLPLPFWYRLHWMELQRSMYLM